MTFIQLQKEIEALQAKAEAARRSEMAGVVSRIRQAVVAYGLTAEELGFGSGAPATASPPAAKKGRRSRMAPSTGTPKSAKRLAKYRDDAGHSWSGRGPKPGWFKAALAAGTPLESLSVDPGAASPASARKATRRPKQALAPKYRDDAGHAWSGRGPKPAWFKDALAAGRTLEDLAA